jgi:hypothetical protein
VFYPNFPEPPQTGDFYPNQDQAILNGGNELEMSESHAKCIPSRIFLVRGSNST